MKPSKEELKALVREYGLLQYKVGLNAGMGKGDKRIAYMDDSLVKTRAISDALSTLCDDAEQVEWVPADGRMHSVEVYIGAAGGRVDILPEWQLPPKWSTHWAPCPPRRMPKPPNGGEKDA